MNEECLKIINPPKKKNMVKTSYRKKKLKIETGVHPNAFSKKVVPGLIARCLSGRLIPLTRC
jgi:hypothetical protein